MARYLKEERLAIKPSIRIAVNVDLTDAEIDTLVDVLDQAGQQLVSSSSSGAN